MALSALFLSVAFVAPEGISVVVSGAAGRTGSLLYGYLKADARIGEVRALVFGTGTGTPDERKSAASALNCSKCDASEGIYYGDVTVPSSLAPAFAGMDTVAITTAVGSGGFTNDTLTKEVEFDGVEHQAAAIVAGASDVSTKHIVLCSAMGTGISPFANQTHGPPAFLKDIMFWKLNAEAFLAGIRRVGLEPQTLTDSHIHTHKPLQCARTVAYPPLTSHTSAQNAIGQTRVSRTQL